MPNFSRAGKKKLSFWEPPQNSADPPQKLADFPLLPLWNYSSYSDRHFSEPWVVRFHGGKRTLQMVVSLPGAINSKKAMKGATRVDLMLTSPLNKPAAIGSSECTTSILSVLDWFVSALVFRTTREEWASDHLSAKFRAPIMVPSRMA